MQRHSLTSILLVLTIGTLPHTLLAQTSIKIGLAHILIPEGLIEKKVQSIDSLVRVFEGRGVKVTLDYGRYANSLLNQNKIECELIKTGKSNILHRRARCHYPKNKPPFLEQAYWSGFKKNTTFGITIGCSNQAQCHSLSREVFNSVRFDKK